MKNLILAVVAFLLMAGSAHAFPTVSIVWADGQGGATAVLSSPAASSSHTAYIVLTGDPGEPPVLGVFVSIEYDTSELTSVNGAPGFPATEMPLVNLPGMGNEFSPLSIGTNEVTPGIITNFDEKTLATGLETAVSVTLGTIIFHIVSADGSAGEADVIASLQNSGTDTITGGGGNAVFVGADVVPEPASASLGAAALLTLLGLKRLRGRTRA